MYQALYRKYRPIDFDSVVGQFSIVKTLRNSIVNNSFSHAYLFIGPRGTGKTTVSKIFARSINCLNPKNGDACGKCEACLSSFSKECMDILEIDAASNNSVDEIRELRNKISLVPSDLKYKVYIIDEVHMLSIGAFNALLKTLEEPPAHAVFILATTDPQKVPETIVSRCQTFSFQKIPSSLLKARLEYVCKKEKIKVDSEVLDIISNSCDGGMRDALGLLDKLSSFSDSKISLDDFYEINGSISNSEISSFLNDILDGNVQSIINSLQSFDSRGKNIIQILTQLLYYCRNLLVDYFLNQSDVSYSIPLLQSFSFFLNESMFDIKKSSNTLIYVELFLLKFVNDFILISNCKVDNVVDKNFSSIHDNDISEHKDFQESHSINSNEDGLNINGVDLDTSEVINDHNNSLVSDYFSSNIDVSISSPILNLDEIIKVRVHNTLALADKKLLIDEQKLFDKLKDFTFDQQIGYIVCSLLDSKLRVVSSDSMILSYDSSASVKQNLLILDKMSEVYYKITNSLKKIAIISDDEWNSIKNEYINNLKNGIKYEILDEPEVMFEQSNKNDIISNSAIDLFGDIVEIE